MRTILLTLCLLLTTGATYYVSPTGNDTVGTAGTIGDPFKTIRYGMGRMSGGDTLYIRAGIYNEAGLNNALWKSGTVESPTRIEAYNGEAVMFKPSSPSLDWGASYGTTISILNPKSHIWLSGITIDDIDQVCNYHGIALAGVTNVVVTNCIVQNIQSGDGINPREGAAGQWGDGVVIVNNVISNVSWVIRSPDDHKWGIYSRRQNNLVLRGNTITNNQVFGGKGGGIQFKEISNGVLEANSMFVLAGTTGNSYAMETRKATNSVVRNNVGHSPNVGFLVDGTYNSTWDNNTVVSSGTPTGSGYEVVHRGVQFNGNVDGSVNEVGSVWRNNIIWGFTQGIFTSSSQYGEIYLTNNIISGTVGRGGATAFVNVGTITTDPLFTDTADFPDGFKWPLNSPARNAGVDLSSLFAVDYYGTVRPQEGFFDIGFYEWGTGGQMPTVSVVANGTGYAHELGLVPQTFTFTRTESTSGNLTVNYTISGTAVAGTHYTAFSDSVVIPDGSATVTATVTPLAVAGYQGDKTVIVTIDADAAYTIKSPSAATITIAEADPPPQRILRTQPSPGQVSRRGPKL